MLLSQWSPSLLLSSSSLLLLLLRPFLSLSKRPLHRPVFERVERNDAQRRVRLVEQVWRRGEELVERVQLAVDGNTQRLKALRQPVFAAPSPLLKVLLATVRRLLLLLLSLVEPSNGFKAL